MPLEHKLTLSNATAEELRKEAKAILYNILSIPVGYGSKDIDRVVDCIISASVLESAMFQAEAISQTVNICEYYPVDGPVCDCNSDISGGPPCTMEYSNGCQWAIERRSQKGGD